MSSPRTWLTAVRAYSYPASIVPIALGTAFSYREIGELHFGAFVVALLAGIFVHTGCNLLNDLYDYRRGVDREDTFGGSGVLVSGALSEAAIARGAWLCLGLAAGLGFTLVGRVGTPLMVLGVLGIGGAVLYTATPVAAKYHALGEPLVFASMGVGMTVGGYLVQTGTWNTAIVLASLPVGFLVTAILQANDARDLADDRASGIHTLAIALGPRGSRALFSALVAATYLSTAVLVIGGIVPAAALVSFVTLPIAASLHRLAFSDTAERSESLRDAPERTAKLHLAFGALYTLGVAFG